MTVAAQNSFIAYTGNGSTAAYSWPYKLFQASDLKVYTVVIATGVETLQTSGGGGTYDYNINGALDTVTLNNNLPATHKLFLTRVQELSQPTDYIEGDAFPAAAHEDTLDKIVLQIQQQQEQLNRSIKLSQSNSGSILISSIPTDRAGKALTFDTSGNLLASEEIGDFKGNWASGTEYGARAIVKDTSTASIYICRTGHTSSGSEPLTSNTDAAKWDLLIDGTQAGIATTKAAEAAASATAAASSATGAASSATAAAASQTAAAASESAAASSQSSASGSASTATTKASEAADSATAAAASASSAAASAGGGAIKVTASDSAPDVLNNKLLVQGITKTIANPGGNETLTLKGGADIYAFLKTDTNGDGDNEDLILHYTNQADDLDVATNNGTSVDKFDESFIAPAGLSIQINAAGFLTMTV